MNCFGNIPDAGATYSIALYVDIPINSAPSIPTTALGNPGHTFLRLTKANGSQVVNQIFGFYPADRLKSTLLEPVASEIHNDSKDLNQAHEFNAVYSIESISQSQFSFAISLIKFNSHKQYDLNNYNCSHFATEIVNAMLPNSEKIVPTNWWLPVPNTNPPTFYPMTNSPTGLYDALKRMKDSNAQGASRINYNVKLKAETVSKGECN